MCTENEANDNNCHESESLRRGTRVTFLCKIGTANPVCIENKSLIAPRAITLDSILWRAKCDRFDVSQTQWGSCETTYDSK